MVTSVALLELMPLVIVIAAALTLLLMIMVRSVALFCDALHCWPTVNSHIKFIDCKTIITTSSILWIGIW